MIWRRKLAGLAGVSVLTGADIERCAGGARTNEKAATILSAPFTSLYQVNRADG